MQLTTTFFAVFLLPSDLGSETKTPKDDVANCMAFHVKVSVHQISSKPLLLMDLQGAFEDAISSILERLKRYYLSEEANRQAEGQAPEFDHQAYICISETEHLQTGS